MVKYKLWGGQVTSQREINIRLESTCWFPLLFLSSSLTVAISLCGTLSYRIPLAGGRVDPIPNHPIVRLTWNKKKKRQNMKPDSRSKTYITLLVSQFIVIKSLGQPSLVLWPFLPPGLLHHHVCSVWPQVLTPEYLKYFPACSQILVKILRCFVVDVCF